MALVIIHCLLTCYCQCYLQSMDGISDFPHTNAKNINNIKVLVQWCSITILITARHVTAYLR